RRHANFAEWVPLAVILIALLEMTGGSRIAIHSLGAALVVVRACHAVGLKADTMQGMGRFVGAAGTAPSSRSPRSGALSVFSSPDCCLDPAFARVTSGRTWKRSVITSQAGIHQIHTCSPRIERLTPCLQARMPHATRGADHADTISATPPGAIRPTFAFLA